MKTELVFHCRDCNKVLRKQNKSLRCSNCQTDNKYKSRVQQLERQLKLYEIVLRDYSRKLMDAGLIETNWEGNNE